MRPVPAILSHVPKGQVGAFAKLLATEGSISTKPLLTALFTTLSGGRLGTSATDDVVTSSRRLPTESVRREGILSSCSS